MRARLRHVVAAACLATRLAHAGPVLAAGSPSAPPPPAAGTRLGSPPPEPVPGAPEGADVRRDTPEVVRLGQRLRCPVCQGMAIGDSPAPMAQDMMRQVRRMWADGRNEDDIAAYFTARYGDWVLLDPPWRGAGLWIWVLPPLALVGGIAAALQAMRGRVAAARTAGRRGAAAPGATAAHLPVPRGGADAPTPADVDAEALRAIREEVAG